MTSRDANVVEGVPLLEGEDRDFEPLTLSEHDEKASALDRFYQLLRTRQWSLSSLQRLLRWDQDRAQHMLSFASRSLSFCIPSFVRQSPTSTQELHETAYLDGLRGYACYAVFFAHHFTAYCFEVWHPYGEGPNLHFVQTNYLFQIPIIRALYNGQAAITIFFVLSGYVLSYKPLKLIHARDYEKLQRCLASSIFRRWWRLFLPVAALWIINIFLVELGAFSWFDTFRAEHPKIPPGFVETYLARGESFWGTVYNGWADFLDFTRYTLFAWIGSGHLPQVDGHTWTLHVEFRSSCYLFLFLHGTSAMQPNLRLGFFLLSTAVCLCWDQWAIATFLAGSAIADLDLRMRRMQAARPSTNEVSEFESLPMMSSSGKASILREIIRSHSDQLFWGGLFILSLLLLSYPNNAPTGLFFYSFLWSIHPSSAWDLFFWLSIGGIILVFVAGRLRFFKSILESRFSQYIGQTSFALYLVHGTVIKSLGHFTVIQTWNHITGYHGWGYAAGIILPLLLVVGPVVIVASDMFWRGIDQPTMRFGRWLENLVKDKIV